MALRLALVSGAAALVFLGVRVARRGRCDRYKAYVKLLDLPPGPAAGSQVLAGLCFAIKDIFDVKGEVTGFGNPTWLRTHKPATSHAENVRQLLAAGARANGVVHMDELAYSISGENAHYGTPVNPANPKMIPGGSSSGGAVAVAGHLADFAMGTDTGGSVRVPAACCGVYGLRPTHGVVSEVGCLELSHTFDTVGWHARDPATMRRVGQVLLRLPPSPPPGSAPTKLIVATDLLELCEPAVLAAVGSLLSAARAAFPGAAVAPMDLGSWLEAKCPGLGRFKEKGDSIFAANRAAFRMLQGFDFWQAHGSWIEEHKWPLGSDVVVRAKMGAAVTKEVAAAARAAKAEMVAAMGALLSGGAILVHPTVVSSCPLGAPPEGPWRTKSMHLLCIAGMGSLPQMHIPIGKDEAGAPVGASLVGTQGADGLLLDSAVTLADKPAKAYAEARATGSDGGLKAAIAACAKA